MIRIAIIGTGRIAEAHIRAWLQFPERCVIAALVNRTPEKAQRLKEQFHLDVEVFADDRQLHDIDLADICTPPFTHAEISIRCMRAGMDVACEKPMAASLEECDAMLRAREETGRRLTVIAQNRFLQPHANLKALLDSGIAGPVLAAQVDSLWWRGHNYYDLWWRGTWEQEGGGCTLNHAVHHVDLLLWMMGGLPEAVTGVLINAAHDNAQVEDLSMSILRYPGALVQLTASVLHHRDSRSMVFQCAEASLSAPFACTAQTQLPDGFPQRNEVLEQQIIAAEAALPRLTLEGFPGQMDSILTSVERDMPMAVTGEDGRRAVELICAIYQSAAQGRTVSLPLTPEDPFYSVRGIRENAPRFENHNGNS